MWKAKPGSNGARQRVSGECGRSECRIGVGAPLGATQPGGVHPPERGFFRKDWPFREHVCRPAVNRKAENSVVRFVWLPKHGKFEATLRRGGGLAFINANNRYRMQGVLSGRI